MKIRDHLRAIGEQLVIRAVERLLPGRRVVRGYHVRDGRVEIIVDRFDAATVQESVRRTILDFLEHSAN